VKPLQRAAAAGVGGAGPLARRPGCRIMPADSSPGGAMPSIEIRRNHSKSMKEARAAVDRVAARIAERFDVTHGWEGDTLFFRRSGVDGHIALEKGSVHVTVNLGFLLMALRGPVEAEIHRKIDEEFA
jgi:putative polyhydroxyalkanoate system protein